MTPADKRMMELLERWLTSLDLHLRYADLPEAAYLAVQPWPKHDRPTRWIIELARQKTLELKAQQESRIAMGDSKFADSLELMAFLANLVGSEHVQRFIPLADPAKEQKAPPRTITADATREMPKMPSPAPPARKIQETPIASKPAATPKPGPKSSRKAPAALAASSKASSPALQKKVMADAVRLLNWGKKWHELAELIARIADRPPVAEVRRILRSHKAEIEMQAESDD